MFVKFFILTVDMFQYLTVEIKLGSSNDDASSVIQTDLWTHLKLWHMMRFLAFLSYEISTHLGSFQNHWALSQHVLKIKSGIHVESVLQRDTGGTLECRGLHMLHAVHMRFRRVGCSPHYRFSFVFKLKLLLKCGRSSSRVFYLLRALPPALTCKHLYTFFHICKSFIWYLPLNFSLYWPNNMFYPLPKIPPLKQTLTESFLSLYMFRYASFRCQHAVQWVLTGGHNCIDFYYDQRTSSAEIKQITKTVKK